MSRLNFPDSPHKGDVHVQNEQMFKFDGNGWTKQLLSGNVVLDANISHDRLLPANAAEKARLKYEGGTWSGDDTIDGGTY